MRKLLPLLLVLMCGCMHNDKVKYDTALQDTIAKVRISGDFSPLNKMEVYDFLNRYYLPRLDTLPIKRKLLLYPINSKDFSRILKDKITYLQEMSSKGIVVIKKKISLPLGLIFDKNHPWDKKKLSNVLFVTDTTIYHSYTNYDTIKSWHKKYGRGYVGISYPLYNIHTKKLYIRECIIRTIGMIDGNADEKELWFRKTSNGWKLIP